VALTFPLQVNSELVSASASKSLSSGRIDYTAIIGATPGPWWLTFESQSD